MLKRPWWKRGRVVLGRETLDDALQRGTFCGDYWKEEETVAVISYDISEYERKTDPVTGISTYCV